MVDVTDIAFAAAIASPAFAILAVWLGFRYQKIVLDRERKGQAYLRAIARLGQMAMVVQAHLDYLRFTGGPALQPDGFSYLNLDRSTDEFRGRLYLILAPAVFGEGAYHRNVLRGLVPAAQEEEAGWWLDGVVAFFRQFNRRTLEFAAAIGELEAHSVAPSVLKELMAIRDTLDRCLLDALRGRLDPQFRIAQVQARVDQLQTLYRRDMGV